VTEETPPVDPKDFRNLDFSVDRSRRYHNKLLAHYDNLNRLSMTFVLVGGSTTLGTLLNSTGTKLPIVASAVITTVAALDRTFGFAEKARIHQDLYRRFSSLSARVKVAGEHLTKEKFDELSSDNIKIQSDEPGEKRMLNLICYNEERVARAKSKIFKIPWYIAMTAHFINWPWEPKIIKTVEATPVAPTPPSGSSAGSGDFPTLPTPPVP